MAFPKGFLAGNGFSQRVSEADPGVDPSGIQTKVVKPKVIADNPEMVKHMLEVLMR